MCVCVCVCVCVVLVGRALAGVQSQVELYQRLKKMIRDTSLLNTKNYKVRIKCKVDQSKERNNTIPYISV